MNQQAEKNGHTLGAILLISGTSIGAGMLGIPLLTGLAGFLPCLLANAVCCILMLCTALALLEVTLWMDDGANYISMTKRFFGPIGESIGGAFYLFLYYCLLTAYFAGGTPLFINAINTIFGIAISQSLGYSLFFLLFSTIIFLGIHITDRMNFLLMIGMVASYVILIGLGSSSVNVDLLKRSHLSLSWVAFPILLSAYGFHNIIPTISTYLKRDAKSLRISITIGIIIPFIIYSIWQWMIIGSLPLDVLNDTLDKGIPVTAALKSVMKNSWVATLGQYFSFFALVTSLLGVSLSMVDFYGDGLKMKRTGLSRLGLCFLVFLPPAFFAWGNPKMFITALEYAGGFGEAILNGFIPLLMVWIGRYHMKIRGDKQLPGGRIALVVLLFATLGVSVLEIINIFR